MKRLELINIICDVLQEEGIPYSIIDSVVLDSIYAGSDEFDLEKVDNKYIIECKNNDIDYRYELLIDSNSKKYSLDIKATTKDNSEVVCYSEEKRTKRFI